MGGRVATDETGNIYGKLRVIHREGAKGRCATWGCICSCGKYTVVSGGSLRRGATTSCGCGQNDVITKHGMYETATYRSWNHMKQRCDNPRCHQYSDYGGKGITYDPRWVSFENFLEDMGERPEGTSLNRIRRARVYSKETCNWASKSEQNYDKSSSRNTSGKIGVWFNKKRKVWVAEIKVNHRKIVLGSFSVFEDAVCARKEAELKYFGYTKE